MKIKLTLRDFTLNAAIKQLQNILEAPFFSINGVKYSKGILYEHYLKDSEEFLNNNKLRPLIFFKYSGSLGLDFYENDMFIFDNKDNILLKGSQDLIFSLTSVTKKEADLIENLVNVNNYYTSLYNPFQRPIEETN